MRRWLVLLVLCGTTVVAGCAPQTVSSPTPGVSTGAGSVGDPAPGTPAPLQPATGAAEAPPPNPATPSVSRSSARRRTANVSLPPAPPPERYPLSLRSSCFVNHLGEESWLPEAAASTVLVIAANGSGGQVMATGWVVKDSSVEGGLANAILTSLHGVQESMKDGILAIVSAFGRPIGWAEIEVKAASRGGQTDTTGAVIPTGDIALLRLRGFAPGGAEVYRSIQGIEIAREQHSRIMRGTFANPAGIDFGASGSPVLDEQGRAIGVMVRRWDRNEGGMWRSKVEVAGGSPLEQRRVGHPNTTTTVNLPDKATGYVEPIFDPNLLSRLGPPGQGLIVRESSDRRPSKVFVPGFPRNTCVIYRGEVSPL